MKTSFFSRGPWLSLVASVLAVGGARAADVLSPPKVKPELAVPSSFKVLLKAAARGVQIYTCKASGGQFAWSPATPDAILMDYGNNIIIHHYKGPTWEAADGSKVSGITPPAGSDTPNPNAIAWLKLQATGTGKFSNVGFVQRVDTEGGKAPASGCDAANAGNEARVDYKANYYFYVPAK